MSSDKLLVVHTGGIGDMIMARPVLKALESAFPKARIDVLGHPLSLEVLRLGAFGGRRIPFDSSRKDWRHALGLLHDLRRLRLVRYDRLFLLQPVLSKGSHWRLSILARVVGARVSYARASRFGRQFADMITDEPADLHEVDRMLGVAALAGVSTKVPVDYRLSTDGFELSNKFNIIPSCYVVLSPGGTKPFRRWPFDRFLDLARRFSDSGMTPVLVGSKSERNMLHSFPEGLPAGVLDLVGQTDFAELCTLLRHAAVVVANDSGPMHLANALGTPVVGIFGSGDVVRTGPYLRDRAKVADAGDRPCRPCYVQQCDRPDCMVELTMDAVWNAVRELGQ